MKLLAYSVREDEKIYFESYGKKYGMEVIIREDAPSFGSGAAESLNFRSFGYAGNSLSFENFWYV